MIAWAVRHGLEDTWFCGSDLGGALPPVRGSSCPSWVGLPIPSFKGLWCATGLLQLGNAADPWSQKDIERRMYHKEMLQRSNARLLQTKWWQSCPGVVVQLYRRHVVQRHHAEWVLLPLPFVLLAQVALGIFTAKLPADSNLYRRAIQLITFSHPLVNIQKAMEFYSFLSGKYKTIWHYMTMVIFNSKLLVITRGYPGTGSISDMDAEKPWGFPETENDLRLSIF